MSSSVRQGEFYPVWPILDGKPLQLQWGEERSNTAETKAIVRGSFQDIEDGVDSLNSIRAYIGQAFGDIDFDNKYRFIYKKDTEEFCVQQNNGTQAVPDWVDVWCIRFSDGQFQVTSEGGIQSNAGFYGPQAHDLDVIGEAGSDANTFFTRPNELYFNTDHGFYLTSDSNSKPIVNMAFPFGRSQTFSRTGREWQIQHNYGVTPVLVQVMNDGDRVIIPDQADVSDPNIAYFYFHEVVSGKALIATGGTGAVELLPKDPFYLAVRANDQGAAGRILRPNADLIFDSDWFYVNTDDSPQHGKAFVSLTDAATAFQDHSNLSNLGNDDHLQYAPVDGSRDFTGDVTVGTGAEVARTLTIDAGSLTARDAIISLNSVGTPNWTIKNDTNVAGQNYFVISDELNGQSIIAAQPGVRLPALTFEGDTGELVVDGYLLAIDDARVEGKVTAEAFYVTDGGELSHEGLITTNGAFSDRVVADAFYLTPGSGGEFSKSGNDVLIKSSDGQVVIDDELLVTGKVVAENFYTSSGAAVGGVSDHGALTGLADDDHTQYSLVDGTRDFTGDVTLDAASDFDRTLTINAGATVDRDAQIDLQNQGTTEWRIGNDASSSRFEITDAVSFNTPLAITQGSPSNALAIAAGTTTMTNTTLQVVGSESISGELTVGDYTELQASLGVENVVTAEAFYIQSGGELSADGLIATEGLIQNNADATAQLTINSGSTSEQISQLRLETQGDLQWLMRSLPTTGDLQITSGAGASPIEIDALASNKSIFIQGSPNAKVSSTVDWDFSKGVTIADDLRVEDKVVAEAFYLPSGGGLGSDGLRIDTSFLTGKSTAHSFYVHGNGGSLGPDGFSGIILDGPRRRAKDEGFGAGWSEFGGAWQKPEFRLESNGVVRLYGLCKKSTALTSNDVIFELPVGYRPAVNWRFTASALIGGTILHMDLAVDFGGNVQVLGPVTGVNVTWLSLSTITFLAFPWPT